MLLATAPGSFSAKFKNSPPIKQPNSGEREYLRPFEVEALIKAAKGIGRHGVRDGAMILLMFRHGLRTAELVALTSSITPCLWLLFGDQWAGYQSDSGLFGTSKYSAHCSLYSAKSL